MKTTARARTLRHRQTDAEGYRVARFGADEAVRNTEVIVETILTALRVNPHPRPLPKGEGK